MTRKRKQQSGKKFRIIIFCIAVGLGIVAAVHYFTKSNSNPDANFAGYPDFGIDLPVNFPIHGIDVSSYQGKIDWVKVKAMEAQNVKIGFVYIKATEGLESVDTAFDTNWSNTDAAGITHGAYHFFIAGKSGALQAQNFINHVRLSKGDLPPVVDVEELYTAAPATMRSELHEYLNAIENHYHVRPVIYSYASFYNDYLSKEFGDYPLWVAHYFEDVKPRVQRHWDFWQHNEHGHVYGIKNPDVDFNVFGDDSAAFKAMLMQ